MELDSRKKSRRNRMMCSNSFDTPEVREIDWKEAGESRGSHSVDGNNRRYLPDGRKGIQRPGKIKSVKGKIHVRARKVL